MTKENQQVPDIKITKSGYLWLKRGSKLKAQVCPYCSTADGDSMECGDWCPKFRIILDNLMLCDGIDYFGTIVDERE